jgi:hypothetical protein
VQNDVAIIRTGRDVKKSDLIGALLVIALRYLNRITRVA